MSHVFILAATDQRVPRWFTEGLAVHEETEACPEWGDPLSPDVVLALRDKKLLPVLQLDRGFIRPQYPAQVIVSYFEAGRICDYIKVRWGDDKLLAMVHSFAEHKDTAAAIHENLGVAPAEFDGEFQQWLDKQVGATVAHFDDWRNGLKHLAELATQGKYDEVLKEGEEVRRMYPSYVYGGNAYQLLAQADRAKGNDAAAIAMLMDYQRMGGRDLETLGELASLEEKAGQAGEACSTLDKINLIYPMVEARHRHLGGLWLAQGNYAGAVREFTAVLALHPLDMASAHFNLARAYYASGQRDKAEQHLLACLEGAPDYRPAQKLLLELEGHSNAN
jgi:tetratricopeptide (TPR) repeat protein